MKSPDWPLPSLAPCPLAWAYGSGALRPGTLSLARLPSPGCRNSFCIFVARGFRASQQPSILPGGHGFPLQQGQPQEEATHHTRARVQAATGNALVETASPVHSFTLHRHRPWTTAPLTCPLTNMHTRRQLWDKTPSKAGFKVPGGGVCPPSHLRRAAKVIAMEAGYLPGGVCSHLPFLVPLDSVTFTQ